MIVHAVILAITAAVLAAFLILWYFWVKKKIELAYALDDEEQVLFPFRYFSWILLAVVLVTCVAQVHFVRVSSTVHENLAAMSSLLKDRQESLAQVNDLKGILEELRTDLDGKFRQLHRESAKPTAVARIPAYTGSTVSDASAKSPERALVMLATKKRPREQTGFEKPAGASSTRVSARPLRRKMAQGSNRMATGIKRENKETKASGEKESLSMDLNLTGRVTADLLRVRKRPNAQGSVIDRLRGGQQVKVTEKRLAKESMWYRVITPSGIAGWVDYRYLKLDL